MKNFIDKELDVLHTTMVEMAGLCESAIGTAITALCDNNKEFAKKTIQTEFLINKKERDIEDLCLKILLRQQPVAKDLRNISSTLKIITDMERIGDQARDIAEIVENLNLSEYKDSCHLQEIAKATIKMVTDSIDAYINHDLHMCKDVIQYDDIVDDLFEQIKVDVVDLVSNNSTKTLDGMYVLMVGKYFERIGDHATNIAEWVVFSITGDHKEMK